MDPQVLGIAGLPGSGKSRLMDDLSSRGYSRYDDINRNWGGNLPKARSEVRQGKRVAISDIMFCEEKWRKLLEQELGIAIQWIFFENNPWQCAKNCLFRFAYSKPTRPLQDEIQKIRELHRVYNPVGQTQAVPHADSQIPDKWADR